MAGGVHAQRRGADDLTGAAPRAERGDLAAGHQVLPERGAIRGGRRRTGARLPRELPESGGTAVTALPAQQVRRRFLALQGLRWLPIGLMTPVMILLMQQRGLSLPQIGLLVTAQGLVVLTLELPTGGLADALGRKPVLATAWTVNLVSLGLFALADSFALF